MPMSDADVSILNSFRLCPPVDAPLQLACARGAFHFAGTQFDNSDSGAPTINMDEWRQNFHETHDRLKRMMYFL